MKRSRLIVSITAPPGDIFFELVLKRPNEAFSEKIVTQKRKLCFELEKGEYQVEIRNGAFLNPMGIIMDRPKKMQQWANFRLFSISLLSKRGQDA